MLNSNYLILTAFTVLLVWEAKLPKQEQEYSSQRWLGNFLLALIPILISLFFVQSNIFFIEKDTPSVWLDYGDITANIIGILLLDFYLYFLHRLSHRSKLLWRAHRLHHSDPVLDVSTNFRHHPFELCWVLIGMLIFIKALNIPADIFANYILLSTLIQLWHHSNIYLPSKVDKALSLILVTPSIHQLHHSLDFKESNSNYGTLLSIWDRAFQTFIQPAYLDIKAEKNLSFGVKGYSSSKQQNLYSMLIQPFENKK